MCWQKKILIIITLVGADKMNPKVQAFIDELKEKGLTDSQYRELVVMSDRILNVLLVLGMNGINEVSTDLLTAAGHQPLFVLESAVRGDKPIRQVVTDILKSFGMIAVQDEMFESKDEFSGNIVYVMRKDEKVVKLRMEMPFWDGLIGALGNRNVMKFLDTVSS